MNKVALALYPINKSFHFINMRLLGEGPWYKHPLAGDIYLGFFFPLLAIVFVVLLVILVGWAGIKIANKGIARLRGRKTKARMA